MSSQCAFPLMYKIRCQFMHSYILIFERQEVRYPEETKKRHTQFGSPIPPPSDHHWHAIPGGIICVAK